MFQITRVFALAWLAAVAGSWKIYHRPSEGARRPCNEQFQPEQIWWPSKKVQPQQFTYKSLKSHLKCGPLLPYPFSGTVNIISSHGTESHNKLNIMWYNATCYNIIWPGMCFRQISSYHVVSYFSWLDARTMRKDAWNGRLSKSLTMTVPPSTLLLLRTQPGEFHEPGFWYVLQAFCVDSSSPQISAILAGHFYSGKLRQIALSADLRNSLQNFHEQCAKRCKSPGSVNSLAQPKEMHTVVLGCRQMGSTLMGPLQKYWILTDWGKRYALALWGR